MRRVSSASILRRVSSRSRSESEILVNRTPKPKLGIRYITTPCIEKYSPSCRVSLRLSVSPISTGASVSIKHPVALMSTVRARDLLPDPSQDTSITSGRRPCFLFSSVIICPLRLLLLVYCWAVRGVTTIFEDAQGRGHPGLGNNTPRERHQPKSLCVSDLILPRCSTQTLIRISVVLYSDVLPACRLQQAKAWPKPRRVE